MPNESQYINIDCYFNARQDDMSFAPPKFAHNMNKPNCKYVKKVVYRLGLRKKSYIYALRTTTTDNIRVLHFSSFYFVI